MRGSLSTGVPTVSGMVSSSRSPTAPAPMSNRSRARQVGRASSRAGRKSTGQVFTEIASAISTPASTTRGAGPRRRATNAPTANSRHSGSICPCTALTKIAIGVHAYWNARRPAFSGRASR